AWLSKDMYDTMDLCIGCKGCKRECPTGVDMAKMKTEFLYHYHQANPHRLRDRMVAYLPRYAPVAARFAGLLNLRNTVPAFARMSEQMLGFSARRDMPNWNKHPFDPEALTGEFKGGTRGEVVLFVDTFNTYFEPNNARAALRVLQAAGYRVHLPCPDDSRPLCCGRTFLAKGMVDEARVEAQRTLDYFVPYAARGIPIIGLEPSCLLTLRDELQSLFPTDNARMLGKHALLIEEFLAAEHRAAKLSLPLGTLPGRNKVLLHGHCHQKAFGLMPAVQQCLKLIPGLEVETIESGCCGLAGPFGYEAEHYDVSMRMAELNLLPAVRAADPDTLIVADGTSCRHQIEHGANRPALHVARVLELALDGA
ncbi:MAG TPA: heterodisulfide reductase-related iron-sulfur binding cluster, partial [Burkholderiales bacterium]